jgi:hypothetical protein
MVNTNKTIQEMSIEELEKIELLLWRQREQATLTLNNCNRDLQLISNEIVSRNM